MRIKSIRVKNFRCLEDVRVDMEALTSFVGPNGAGKSTVLRALDWFFNGEPRLVDEDVYSGAVDNRRISVEVKFSDLTVADREALGSTYAPPGSTTFTAWRIWEDGNDKMTARARSFPAFEEIRMAGSAKEKKGLWDDLIARGEAPGLPKWTNLGAADQAMTLWESDNPDRLEETESGVTHLFGFNGQNKLSGLFDFVLVAADFAPARRAWRVRRRLSDASSNAQLTGRVPTQRLRLLRERSARSRRRSMRNTWASSSMIWLRR
jgi:hypothetical protein